ncbi:MAG: 2Fe-2S iron-sulfur cluster binding domain-containing protein [Gammaproteobacteria bacterium]|nr:2Fe-2S iron-sulfur cluster binding domain-containing protein [Gammaproteobacteria bacterium]
MRFVHPDGRIEERLGVAGESVMECAVDHEVEGIVAQCGGAAICGTCHCHVMPAWRARLEPPDEVELELLGYLEGHDADSRLACQIVLSAELDGIEVRLPD